MKKFDYKLMEVPASTPLFEQERYLCNVGGEGWELVSALSLRNSQVILLFLKREII